MAQSSQVSWTKVNRANQIEASLHLCSTSLLYFPKDILEIMRGPTLFFP